MTGGAWGGLPWYFYHPIVWMNGVWGYFVEDGEKRLFVKSHEPDLKRLARFLGKKPKIRVIQNTDKAS